MHSRSKGQTEDGLAAMGYELISFRAGYLAQAERGRQPMTETIMKYILAASSSPLQHTNQSVTAYRPVSSVLSHFSFGSTIQIPVSTSFN